MGCKAVRSQAGVVAIVCGLPRPRPCETPSCAHARIPHIALCDFPVIRNGRPGTCSRRMCESCRWSVPTPGPRELGDDDLDYCPVHRRIHELQQRRAQIEREALAITMSCPCVSGGGGVLRFGGEEVLVRAGMTKEEIEAEIGPAWERHKQRVST